MGMGFARSARVMSQLEAAGIVGPQNSSKNRDVLVNSLVELDEILKRYLK
jgi:S-DNA-T family DNA segregation ATPase FtsK/SpoIIIE